MEDHELFSSLNNSPAVNRRPIRQSSSDKSDKNKYNFDKDEKRSLNHIYNVIIKYCDEFDIDVFVEFMFTNFRITDDRILCRLFAIFDLDNDSKISRIEWMRGMDIFLRGTMEQQIKFCFDVYDITSDQNLQREELKYFLRNCLRVMPSRKSLDDEENDLIQAIMNFVDITKDNNISFEDYRKTVLVHPQMLQFLGMCLPMANLRDAFTMYITTSSLGSPVSRCVEEHFETSSMNDTDVVAPDEIEDAYLLDMYRKY